MNNLDKLAGTLFAQEGEQKDFKTALTERSGAAPAILWVRERSLLPFDVLPPAAWQPAYVDRVYPGEKPGKSPLHIEGKFYCLDLGSVFMAVPFLNLGSDLHVFDVCSSPGGKALLAWTALRPGLLIANETIGKRTAALISNFERCSVDRIVVTSMDPQVLGEIFPRSSNIVIVDAPCSGQALVAKGSTSGSCFHPVTINRNAMRQRRIISNAAKLTAPGGYLAYMTCAFSREENEGVVEWFLKQQTDFEPVEIAVLSRYQSHLADRPCYRLWPHQGEGSGAFTCLLRQKGDGRKVPIKLSGVKILWPKQIEPGTP